MLAAATPFVVDSRVERELDKLVDGGVDGCGALVGSVADGKAWVFCAAPCSTADAAGLPAFTAALQEGLEGGTDVLGWYTVSTVPPTGPPVPSRSQVEAAGGCLLLLSASGGHPRYSAKAALIDDGAVRLHPQAPKFHPHVAANTVRVACDVVVKLHVAAEALRADDAGVALGHVQHQFQRRAALLHTAAVAATSPLSPPLRAAIPLHAVAPPAAATPASTWRLSALFPVDAPPGGAAGAMSGSVAVPCSALVPSSGTVGNAVAALAQAMRRQERVVLGWAQRALQGRASSSQLPEPAVAPASPHGGVVPQVFTFDADALPTVAPVPTRRRSDADGAGAGAGSGAAGAGTGAGADGDLDDAAAWDSDFDVGSFEVTDAGDADPPSAPTPPPAAPSPAQASPPVPFDGPTPASSPPPASSGAAASDASGTTAATKPGVSPWVPVLAFGSLLVLAVVLALLRTHLKSGPDL